MSVSRQGGNAIIMVLIAVVLFAGLAYTFMRGAKSGTGNLTSQQVKIRTQELANFLNKVDRAVDKLRRKGCSESDISFTNPGDSAGYAIQNGSATAPSDYSCHIFNPAGGDVTFDMDLSEYQVPFDQVTAEPQQHDQLHFTFAGISIVGLGTSANEKMFSFTHIDPAICDAYNKLLGLDVDLTVLESMQGTDPIFGNENTAIAGKNTFCIRINNTHLNNGPSYRILYIWSVN